MELNSTWSPDHEHHGDVIKKGKGFVGSLVTYNNYTEYSLEEVSSFALKLIQNVKSAGLS